MTITGAFAGAGIQYVIPATLVWLARKKLAQLEGEVMFVVIILMKWMPLQMMILVLADQNKVLELRNNIQS